MDAAVTIACLLTDKELQERRSAYLDRAASLIVGRRELADGLEFTFRIEEGTIDLLAEIVELERKCCPFLDFKTTWRPDLSTAVVSITGPPGAKEAVGSLFGWN